MDGTTRKARQDPIKGKMSDIMVTPHHSIANYQLD